MSPIVSRLDCNATNPARRFVVAPNSEKAPMIKGLIAFLLVFNMDLSTLFELKFAVAKTTPNVNENTNPAITIIPHKERVLPGWRSMASVRNTDQTKR